MGCGWFQQLLTGRRQHVHQITQKPNCSYVAALPACNKINSHIDVSEKGSTGLYMIVKAETC